MRGGRSKTMTAKRNYSLVVLVVMVTLVFSEVEEICVSVVLTIG
jgi:hypothetical protein